MRVFRYVERGAVGAEILEKEGYKKALCDIVACHVGHGFTKEHIKEVLSGNLPLRNLSSKTTEERLVNNVSKLHSKANEPQFNSVMAYQKFVKNIGNAYYTSDMESLVQEFGAPIYNRWRKNLDTHWHNYSLLCICRFA